MSIPRCPLISAADRKRTHWQPFEDFETFWLIRQKTPEVIAKLWAAKVKDPLVGAKHENGQWLIPKFAGVFSDEVDSSMTGDVVSRHIDPNVAPGGLAELLRDGDALLDQAGKQAHANILDHSGSGSLVSSGPHVPMHEAAGPLCRTLPSSSIATFDRSMKRKAAAEEEFELQLRQKVEENPSVKVKVAKKQRTTVDAFRLEVWNFLSQEAAKVNNMAATQKQFMEDQGALATKLIKIATHEGCDLIAKRDAALSIAKEASKQMMSAVVDFRTENLTQDALTALVQFDDLESYKEQAAEKVKAFKADAVFKNCKVAVKTIEQLMKKYETELSKHTKGNGKKKKGGGDDAAKAPVLGVARALKTMFDTSTAPDFDRNVTDSFTEFGQEKAVLSNIKKIEEFAGIVTALPYFSSQSDWVGKHMESNGYDTASASIMQTDAAKKIEVEKNARIPEPLRQVRKFIGSEHIWASPILETQIVCCAKGMCNVRVVPYGIGDIRIGLTGKTALIVLPLGKCPGATCLAKVKFLEEATMEQLAELIDKGAHRMLLTAGTLVAIPPCSIVLALNVGADDSQLLRWGSMPIDKKVTQTIYDTISSLVIDYPELEAHGYTKWQEYLGEMLTNGDV